MKKEKLIINGNAFYEIDLECFEKKKKDSKHFPDKKAGIHSLQHTQKRQRSSRNHCHCCSRIRFHIHCFRTDTSDR